MSSRLEETNNMEKKKIVSWERSMESHLRCRILRLCLLINVSEVSFVEFFIVSDICVGVAVKDFKNERWILFHYFRYVFTTSAKLISRFFCFGLQEFHIRLPLHYLTARNSTFFSPPQQIATMCFWWHIQNFLVYYIAVKKKNKEIYIFITV